MNIRLPTKKVFIVKITGVCPVVLIKSEILIKEDSKKI